MDLDYIMTILGEKQDEGALQDTKISADGGFIEGFWKGIIGMKVGKSKIFDVPPDI